MTKLLKKSDSELLKEAVMLVKAARNQAVRQTNNLIVFTYFHLGRLIVEHKQAGRSKAKYGKETIHKVSRRLTSEFGTGYSERNLEQMRLFFNLFRKRWAAIQIPQTPSAELKKSTTRKKSQTPSAKFGNSVNRPLSTQGSFAQAFPLSWSHYVTLSRIDHEAERNFYEIEATQGHWSVRELQRQYDSSLFERLSLSKDKKKVKELASKGQIIEQPEDILKSPYILEFLGLDAKASYTETDLESAIISKIEHFLLEMGKGFLFSGRQVRFSFDGEDFFVDLVLYNRLLRCFVLVDLKIGKLKHQDIGQMQMYVNFYDRYVKQDMENPTIGIVICKDKSDAVVEITLPRDNKTIFAKEYRLYLPSKAELKKLIG
jgi:predicted nuclease of restriction endonuclease-like (RecB) superfamily